MEPSLFVRSAAGVSSSPARILRSLSRFVPFALAAAMGCQPIANEVENGRVEILEREKAELQRQLEASRASDIQKATLLRDINKALDEMAGRTLEVRRLQNELEPTTFATRTDLKEKIFSDLEFLQRILESSRERAEREANQLAIDSELLASLRTRLDEKERDIVLLRDRMTSLEQEAASYREQLEADRAERRAVAASLLDLRRRLDASRAREPEPYRRGQSVANRLGRQVQPFEDWRTSRGTTGVFAGPPTRRHDFGWVYYLVGSPEQIAAAFDRGDILSHQGTYHVPESALLRGHSPRMFRRMSTEQRVIHIGYGLRDEKVISVHRWNEGLFEFVEDESGATALRVNNPHAFWQPGRYLIVEAER